MSQQIRFFEKSKCDFSNASVSIVASTGNAYVERILDRSNLTAWMTTGSVDASNPTIEIDFGDIRPVDTILLVKMNFKSYKIEYWDGAVWVSIVDVTMAAVTTAFHQFTKVDTRKLKLTIRGTQVPNSEKKLYQFIATEQIGQFNGWPEIKKAISSRNRVRTKMLSGKENIREQIGAFNVALSVKILRDDHDLTLIETLHASNDGFLTWLCGGDEAQFSSARKGYRLEDIYLMKCLNELSNEFYQSTYPNGLMPKFELIEVVD